MAAVSKTARRGSSPCAGAILVLDVITFPDGREHIGRMTTGSKVLSDETCCPAFDEHAGTVRVLHTLRPFAVAMAGVGEFDPWKD
jgi:hypothetical protein